MEQTSDTGRFLVFRSSAGSGKTTQLVRIFLELALSDKDPGNYGRILGITFTKKAAKEMKERILQNLDALRDPEVPARDPELLRHLQEELSLDEKTIRDRAANAFTHLLHHYSDLSVSTIDKFVHRVVSTFARDLHLPVDFELITEENEMLEQAVDIVIGQSGMDEGLTKALVEFSRAKAEQDKSWHIEKDLLSLSSILLDEESRKWWKTLKEMDIPTLLRIRKQVGERIQELKNKIQKIGHQGWTLIETNGIPPSSFRGGAKSGLPKFFEYLKEPRMDKLSPSKTVIETVEEEKWTAQKVRPEDKERIVEVAPQLKDLYARACALLENEVPELHFLELVHQSLYSLALISEVESALEDIREEEDLLLISDLDRVIADIVLKEPAPFIYERIGNRYRDILIDEFQDTSTMQWQNFLPLVENALSMGRTVLLVGDGKQAIYRWRNGNVEQFIKLPAIHEHGDHPNIKDKEPILQQYFDEDKLKKNFRSAKDLVELNNRLFQEMNRRFLGNAENDELSNVYSDLEQTPGNSEKRGYARIEFLEKDEEKGSVKEQTFEKTRDVIRELSGRTELKDIAVLTRTNQEGAAIASYLLEEGIDVVSSQSLLLDQDPEVNFVIDNLRVMTDPNDEQAKLRVVRFLLERDSRESEIHQVLQHHLFERDKRYAIDIQKVLEETGYPQGSAYSPTQPLYETGEAIIRNFDLDRSSSPYLQFLLDHMEEVSKKHGEDIHSFLDHWDELPQKPSIKIPEEMNAIKVLTLHKAKGLEFPTVIMPQVDWAIKYGKDRIWVDPDGYVSDLPVTVVPMKKQLQETPESYMKEEEKEWELSLLDNLNLLYVGMTRAEENLFMFSSVPSGDSQERPSSMEKILYPVMNIQKEWDPESETFETGMHPLERDTKEKPRERTKGYSIEPIIHSTWEGKLKLSLQAPNVWNVGSPEASYSFGTTVHRILEKVRSKADISPVIEEFIQDGTIPKEEADRLSNLVDQVMDKVEVPGLFDGTREVMAEKDIIDQKGNTLRPDRVLIDGDHAIVVDFKTGEERKSHRDQIEKYGSLLKDMGYKNVDKYLIYTEEPKVVEVDGNE